MRSNNMHKKKKNTKFSYSPGFRSEKEAERERVDFQMWLRVEKKIEIKATINWGGREKKMQDGEKN